MFALLTGKIAGKDGSEVILDVLGVGYLISVPARSEEKMKVGQEVKLHIHTAVSEKDIRLFGFERMSELKLFKKLLSVKGVGPKVALGMFELPLQVMENAILGDDWKTLTSISGLGKKTAQQICLDLRDKLEFSFGGEEGESPVLENENGKIQEACEALCNLGCERGEVMRVIVKADAEMSAEEMVKWFFGQQGK